MKLAILADIHGNYPALAAVAKHIDRWRPDQVVVAGDVVNRGPRSLDCWRFVQARRHSHAWHAISGNHDLFVLKLARDSRPAAGDEEIVRQNALWTRNQLGSAVWEITSLAPESSLPAPGGGEASVVHGSMLGNRNNIFPDIPDDELRQKIAPAPELFCCGHTHRPLIRAIDRTLAVNVGSVGAPFDGDPRACYAQLEWRQGRWQATLVRLKYDRARAQRDFQTSGFLDESGPAAQLLYAEFQSAHPHLNTWARRFREAILSGVLTPAEAVAKYLSSL